MGDDPKEKPAATRSINIRVSEEVYDYLKIVAYSQSFPTYPSTIAATYVTDRVRQEKHKDERRERDEHESDRRRVGDRRGLTMAHGSRSKKSHDAS